METSALGFKTKVFPIPANGRKSIRVDLNEIRPAGIWQPPLPGANQLKTNWEIICRDKKAPELTGIKATWIKEGEITLHVFRYSTSTTESFQIKAGKCETLWQRLQKEPAEGMLRFDTLTSSDGDAMNLVVSEGSSPLWP